MQKQIQILGKTYKIIYGDEVDLCGHMGTCNVEQQVIKIKKNIECDQLYDTLLHEVLHIIDLELKLELQESDICRLAVGLYSAGYYQSMQESDL
jgi:hypothetical protein